MTSVLSGSGLVELFREQLSLCKITPDECVIVLSEPDSRPDYVAAAFGAAQMFSSHVADLCVPGGSPSPLPTVRTGTGYGLSALEETPAMRGLLRNADMVIDVTQEGFIHTPVLREILEGDTRVLFICDPPDVLRRNLSQPGDKDLALRLVDRLSDASEMHVTSAAGTDLKADLTDSHPGFQVGFADDPGRWDHWPSAMVLCWPRSSEGQLVLQPGDIIFPFKEYVREPITFQIRNGHIEEINGGAEARRLVQFFADSHDPAARFMSHMGWGFMRNADWHSLGMYSKESIIGMDGRCFPGNFLTSTGPHPFAERDTPYHLDLPLRHCSISLNGERMVDEGRLCWPA